MKVLKLNCRTKIHALAFAPDGALLLSDGRCIQRVDRDSGEAVVIIHCDNTPVAFHPGTHRVAFLPVWAGPSIPPMTGVALADLRRPSHLNWVQLLRGVPFGSVRDLTFCPTGDTIATTFLEEGYSRQGRVQVWDAGDTTLLQTLTFPRPVQALAVGLGGVWLAVAVGYWNQAEVRIYRHGDEAPVLAFTPKRRRVQKIRSAGDASSFVGLAGARLFAVRPGAQPLVTAPADGRGILRDVAVSPDGRLVVTVGDDRCVRTWNAATAEIISQVDWGIGALTAVAFAPDGLTCAAGGKGQVVVWDVDV